MKKVPIMNTLAIMSIFMISSSMAAVNPALQNMTIAFPNVAVSTIRLAATIPSISALIMMFVVAAIAGKIISYKNIAIIGILFMTVGGLVPLFVINSIYLIICSRLFFGIGLGCIGIRNAIILRTYEERKKATMVGISSFTLSISMIVLTLIAGFLADIKWNYAFAVYGFCLVTFLLVSFFLKIPEDSMIHTDIDNVEEKRGKSKIPGAAFTFAVLQFFVTMTAYPVLTTISTFLAIKNLGTAAVAGTVISIFGIGGILIGLIFGKIFHIFKKWAVSIFSFSILFGIALILWGGNSGNLIIIFIGAFICGIGYCAVPSTMTTYAGLVTDNKTVAGSTMLLLAVVQLGVFASTYYITLSGKLFSFMGSEVEGTYLASMIMLAIIAIVFVVFKLAPKEKTQEV